MDIIWERRKKFNNRAVAENGLVPLVNEPIKTWVFSEYISMIADLLLVADMNFTVIHNNYSHKIRDSLVKYLNRQQKRFKMEVIGETNPSKQIKLDECFEWVKREQLRCQEETVNNLIQVFNVIDYKTKKYNEEEMNRFEKNNLVNILKTIEDLDSGIKLGNKETLKGPYSNFKQLSKVRSSLRAINIKRNSVTVV